MTQSITPGFPSLQSALEPGRERRAASSQTMFEDGLGRDEAETPLKLAVQAPVSDEQPRWRLAERVLEFFLPQSVPPQRRTDQLDNEDIAAVVPPMPARIPAEPSEDMGEASPPEAEAHMAGQGISGILKQSIPASVQQEAETIWRSQDTPSGGSEIHHNKPDGPSDAADLRARDLNMQLEGRPNAGDPEQQKRPDGKKSSSPTSSSPIDKTAADGFDEAFSGRASSGEASMPVRVISAQSIPAPALSWQGYDTATASLLAAFQADPALKTAYADATQTLAMAHAGKDRTLHTLKIQLHPVQLGSVTAQLTISGDQLKVEIQVESSDARQRLQADGDDILHALRAMGYDVDRITIQQAATGTSPQSGAGSGNRDSSFQTGANQGQQGDSGGSRGQDANTHAAPPEMTERRQDDAAANNGLYI